MKTTVNITNEFFQQYSYFIKPIIHCVFRWSYKTTGRGFHRALQWFVCLLHANELPLRHLLAKINGKTVGIRGFSGPISKLLVSCENLPIVIFELVGEFNLKI